MCALMGFSSSMLRGSDDDVELHQACKCVCVCVLSCISKPKEQAVPVEGGVENPFLVPPTSSQLCIPTKRFFDFDTNVTARRLSEVVEKQRGGE